MVNIREGGSADHDAAVALWVDAHAARTGERSRAERSQAFRDSLGSPDALLVVAEDRNLVGLALGRQGRADDGAGPPIPGLLHISAVFVEPTRWGGGIGRELVEATLDRALMRDYTKAQLWTQSDNERAARLYEGLGFSRSGREQDHAGERIEHYELVLSRSTGKAR